MTVNHFVHEQALENTVHRVTLWNIVQGSQQARCVPRLLWGAAQPLEVTRPDHMRFLKLVLCRSGI